MTLPPIPKDRNWSPETWRAGLDEAVRRSPCASETWEPFEGCFAEFVKNMVIAHATTLLDAGIVKPVVSEAEELYKETVRLVTLDPTGKNGVLAAIAVIQSALDKARAGL